MSKTRILFSGLFWAIITAGNAYSGSVNDVSGLSITPISNLSSSYQVASSKFLPDFKDSENGWAGNNIGRTYNKNDCSAYPLSSCPSNGKCTKCPVGAGWKLNSCNSGYTKSGNTCTKDAVFCETNATTFLNNIPADYTCDKVKTSTNCTVGKPCDRCYSSCHKINCSGYSLDCNTINKTAAHIATTEICPTCRLSNSNCSKTYCKISACADGYKINAAGTACVEKEDTCPNGYYKSCETGTQGDPKYTEKGTACYQCKAKAVEYMKVVVNFAKSCPAGLSFKMTPQGKSTVTCSSSQCYEYDTGNYPYAPDGIHSNETESVVTVGTQINLSSIPSAVSDIKSVSKKQTYSVSGTTYSFNVNDRATVIAGVGQDTTSGSGLGAYDFWTLQCKQTSTQIGDILYSDMSTSSSVISGKTPIGIVLDSEKKLAVALNEVQKAWSTEYFDITNLTNQSNAKTDWNGKSNTQTIISYCKTNSKSCPAAEYANAYTTTGTSAGNWYLPAGAELNAIFENRDVLNTALDKVSKTKLDAGNNGYQYWSSSEVAANYAYMQSYTSGYNQYKTLTNYVRPVINYGDVSTSTPQQKCLDEGYRLKEDWPKPTASNETVIPSSMLANFMKKVFSMKSAQAAATTPDVAQGCPASMKASCQKDCTSTCQAYYCCTGAQLVTDTVEPVGPIAGEFGETEFLDAYTFTVTATCPYDSNYVKGTWKLNAAISGGSGSSCSGTKLVCQNNTYCCNASTGITSCSQINSATLQKCLMITTSEEKICDGKSLVCNGASYCCSDNLASCSNMSRCSLK